MALSLSILACNVSSSFTSSWSGRNILVDVLKAPVAFFDVQAPIDGEGQAVLIGIARELRLIAGEEQAFRDLCLDCLCHYQRVRRAGGQESR
jgi:hypothetical protein